MIALIIVQVPLTHDESFESIMTCRYIFMFNVLLSIVNFCLQFMDHLMAGIEDILGKHGNHHMRDKFKRFDNRFLRPFLLRNYQVIPNINHCIFGHKHHFLNWLFILGSRAKDFGDLFKASYEGRYRIHAKKCIHYRQYIRRRIDVGHFQKLYKH